MKKQVVTLLVIMLLTNILHAALLTAPASSKITEIKVVNPKTGDKNFMFEAPSTSKGTKFNLTVWIYDVTDLYAHQVNLVVNDTLLNITNAWIPNWNETYVFYGLLTIPVGPVFYDFDEDGVYESALIGDSIMGEGSFTGTGLLAIFELEIIYTPNATKFEGKVASKLNIDNVDTVVLDSDLKDIECVKTDGYYECSYPSPEAGFTFSPLQPYVNQTIIFDASISNASQFFNITQYVWDFGDGNITTTTNQTLTHRYPQNGSYTVSLTVIDEGNLNDTISKLIVVLSPGKSSIDINVDKHEVMVNETVHIFGRIYPNKTGVEVKIFYMLNRTGEDWRELAVVYTNETSQYQYYWTPTQAGVYLIYSSWPGDETASGANNMDDPASVTVKQTSQITISIHPETVDAFTLVEIKGMITPAPEKPVNVKIKYRLFNSTQDWTTLANATAINGNYTYQWTANKSFIGTTNETDTFEFRAEWEGDEITLPSQSQIEKLKVQKTELTISFTINPSKVLPGSNVTITGSVNPPIEGLKIEFGWIRVKDPAEWKPPASWQAVNPKGSTSTESDGTFMKNLTILEEQRPGLYAVMAYFAGDKNIFETNLTEITPAFLNITKFSSSISISADKTEVQIGELIKFAGKIDPPIEGVKVTLLYSMNGGTYYPLPIYGITDANGTYHIMWKAGQILDVWRAGNYSIKAKSEGTELYYAAESPPILVLVNKNSSSITIDVEPEKIEPGGNVTINGVLNPALPNRTIILYIKLNETGETWTSNVLTDANGTFTYLWAPNQTGTYEIYAFWPGDDVYLESSSNIEYVIVQQPFTIYTYLPYIVVAVLIVVVAMIILRRRKVGKPK